MTITEPGTTKRRILERLKRQDGLTARALAESVGVSEVAARQHLDDLAEQGLVRGSAGRPRGPGRPPVVWSLTSLTQGLFPDRHGDLTVSLIGSIRAALGEDGLQRVIDARTEDQARGYRAAVPEADEAPMKERLEALADRRTAEGYMAETADGDGGSMLLIENHCPICDAAQACLGLCRSELDLFRRTLGDDVRVERVEHLLSGGRRCVYRITPAP